MCAAVVPFRRRTERREEWAAELWVLQAGGAGWRRTWRFVLGMWVDALEERREGESTMQALSNDVRGAWRTIRRHPGFSSVTVLILTLGIGLNTTLFAALNAALIQAPPYPDADRLMLVDVLFSPAEESDADTLGWSYPKFELLRERVRALESAVGFAPSFTTLTGSGDAARLDFEYVSPGYFELLGILPRLGRTFGVNEVPPDPGTVAVLSDDLWRTRFGSDPRIVGQTITLGGSTFEVIGVAPAGVRGLTGRADLWVPMAAASTLQSPRRLTLAWAHWLRVVGRLRDGASADDLAAEFEAIGAELTSRFPDPDGPGRHQIGAVGLLEARVNPLARTAITLVSTAGALLLLIACANVAGLAAARADRRRTDAAVRAALGASRSRLLRERLAESLLLAALAGVLGTTLAFALGDLVPLAVQYALETGGTRSLEYLSPAGMRPDGTVLAWSVGSALLAGVVLGLAPSALALGAERSGRLRGGDPAGMGRGGRYGAVRGGLVAGQIALTIVLLSGAGLMVASFRTLSDVALGFSHRDVLTAQFDRGPGSSAAENGSFVQDAVERLGALPGAQGAAFATCPPLAGRCEITGVSRIDDGAPLEGAEMTGALTYVVSDGYFDVVGAPPVQGRGFGAADGQGATPVVVINEIAAARLFPGQNALGHRLALTHSLTAEAMAEVVGVVPDIRYGALEESIMPAVYLSVRQAPPGYGTLLVRGADPDSYGPAMRDVLAGLDPDLPLTAQASLYSLAADATARTRVVLWLLSAFAASGLLMSAVGLYALVSYAISRRTREVGVRVALGAARPSIVALVSRGPALLVLSGAGAGLLTSVRTTRSMTSLLFGVQAGDPRVLAGVIGLLLAVVGLATLVPALRALRVDPVEALRHD